MPRRYRRVAKRRIRRTKRTTRRKTGARRRTVGVRRVHKRRVGGVRRRRIYGRGAYSFGSKASISQTIPTFGAGGEGVIYLSQREQVGIVQIPTGYTGGFMPAKLVSVQGATPSYLDCDFRINAGNAKLNPWGCKIAQKFEMYKAMGCVFFFESLVNTNSTTLTYIPEIIMSSNDNPYVGAPKNSQQMKIQPLSAAGRIDRNLHAGVECHPARLASNGWQYTVALDYKQDPIGSAGWHNDKRDETDIGQFFIAVEGGDTTAAGKNIGKLWVSYKWALNRPIFEEQLNSSAQELVSAAQNKDPLSAANAVEPSEQNKQDPNLRNAERVAIGQEDPHEDEPHMPNNTGHSMFHPSEFEQFWDYKPNMSGFTAWNNAVYPTSGRYAHFNNVKSATNGIPLGHARWAFIETTNASIVPPTNSTNFVKGSLFPYASDTSIRAGTGYTFLSSRCQDNIGFKILQNTTTGTVRFYFVERPRAGAVFRIKVNWSGRILPLNSISNAGLPGIATPGYNELHVIARAPIVTLGSRRHIVELGRQNDTISGCFQTLAGVGGEDTLMTNMIQQIDISNIVTGNTILNNTGSNQIAGAPIHFDWPIFLNTNNMSQEFWIKITEAVETNNTMVYFELSNLTSYRNVLMASTGFSGGASSKFDVSWPTTTVQEPKCAIGDADRNEIRYGSRCVEIFECTYHALPTYKVAQEMYNRSSKYTQDEAWNIYNKFSSNLGADSYVQNNFSSKYTTPAS
jgi:hypothetical protein